MTFINVSDNYIPKAELESNEIKLQSIGGDFWCPGGNIDNNKEAKEKADGLKEEAPSKATPRYEAEDEKSLPIIDERSLLELIKIDDIRNKKKKEFWDK